MTETERDDEVVVDTHSIVWFLARDARLSATARQRLRAIDQDGGRIHVCAITLLEVRFHVEKGRYDQEREQLLYAAVGEPDTSVAEVPVNARIVRHLTVVRRDLIADPYDRLIVATAMELGLPLVTRDREITKSRLVECIW